MTASTRKWLLGGLIIAGVGAFGVASFQKSLTPYVSFAEAMAGGRTVQVKGYPDHANAHFDPGKKAFCFTMTDDAGEAMQVEYRGARPGNFEQAESVVAIGRYEQGVLASEQILVKCPSKYEAEYPGASAPPGATSPKRAVRPQPESPAGVAAPAPAPAPPTPGGVRPQGG